MKFWTAFCCLFLAVQSGFSGLAHWEAFNWGKSFDGKAYVTQANQGSNANEYDIHFGESWQSVRIFKLLEPLDQPLKVYVSSHPQNSALYKDSYRTYVGESLRMWNEALEGRLNFSYTKNRHDADITLDWVPAFPDPYVAGLTTYRVGHAAIEIKTMGVPEADIKGNIIHEIGHALGISGHSNAPDDMMVGTRKWHRTGAAYSPQLSKRDVQAIQRLYSLTWKKGEDLYAAQAQAASVQSVAGLKTNRQNLTLTPLDDTDLIHWKEAQAKETQWPSLKPKYTQIFPN
jgi:predicted Zn-dependent protease